MIGKFWELQQQGKQYRKQNVQWQMEYNLQKEQMYNAHQIEVADLRKAGLSPTLSAGGAGATTPILTPQPTQNLDYTFGNPLEELQSAYSINRTREEAEAVRKRTILQGFETGARLELMDQQTQQMRALLPGMVAQQQAQVRQLLASAGYSQAQAGAIIHDLNRARNRGTSVHPQSPMRDWMDIFNDLLTPGNQPGGGQSIFPEGSQFNQKRRQNTGLPPQG